MRTATTILLALLTLATGAGSASAADVAGWHWSPSPLFDDAGNPLAPVLYYEVFLAVDGGPETMVATVSDTVWHHAPVAGSTYCLRVRAVDSLGRRSALSPPSEVWTVPAPATAADAVALAVGPAWPNPFNPSTVIAYTVPAAVSGPVSLRVLDLRGRLVRTLTADSSPGAHAVRWDGTDERGAAAAAGVYLVLLRCGTAAAVTKVTLVE